MDFSKLKLVTEMLAQGTGTSLTTTANTKATQQSQAGKQISNTSNNIGMQQAQMAQKPKGTGPTMDSKIQKNVAAPNPSPNATGAQAIVSGDDYFDALRARKEFFRKLEENKHDWRRDLTEALGKDDEVFHPYVEVMPMKDFKKQEAKKNLKRQAMEPGSADNPAQKLVKGQMMGIGEEYVDERVYMQPHGSERKKAEKEQKEKNAQAAKDAVRHARVTKGIPGYDAKGKYYLKNGEKIYEEVQLDEAKKSKKDDKAKKSKKGDDDKKSKKKSKLLPDEKTPNYIKNKATLAKISSRMRKSRTEARRHAKDAREYFTKQTQAVKKGDEKSRKHYSQKGAEAQAKARRAKSESDSYIPYGSSTYGKAGKPSEMNQRYFRDRETEAGRRRIALRSLGQ